MQATCLVFLGLYTHLEFKRAAQLWLSILQHIRDCHNAHQIAARQDSSSAVTVQLAGTHHEGI